MTLEKELSCKHNARMMRGDFWIILSVIILAVINACAYHAWVVYSSMLICGIEVGPVDIVQKIANRYYAIYRASQLVNWAIVFFMGMYAHLFKRFRLIMLTPIVGFSIISYFLFRFLVGLVPSHFTSYRMLEFDDAAIWVGIFMMIPAMYYVGTWIIAVMKESIKTI